MIFFQRVSFRLFLLMGLSGTGHVASADEKTFRSGIVWEGSYEKADVAQPLTNARATQLVVVEEWDYGVRALKAEKNKRTWEEWQALSKQIGGSLLKEIKPEYIRDSRGVIDYAIIEHKDPFLTSILGAPGFLEMFADTLGDYLNIVVPDRNLIYIFPAAGGKLAEYSAMIEDRFRSVPRRVSLEVFQLDKTGLKSVGEIKRGYESNEEVEKEESE